MKRADGTALSVIVVMFDHHKSLRNHRDTRTLGQYAILSRTISVHHERRSSCDRPVGAHHPWAVGPERSGRSILKLEANLVVSLRWAPRGGLLHPWSHAPSWV